MGTPQHWGPIGAWEVHDNLMYTALCSGMECVCLCEVLAPRWNMQSASTEHVCICGLMLNTAGLQEFNNTIIIAALCSGTCALQQMQQMA